MKAQIVSFHCVLKNKLGHVLSTSFNEDVINQIESGLPGPGSSRLRGLAAGIQNVRQGEKREFTVPANEAYGAYDPNRVITVRRSELVMGDRLELGSEIMSKPSMNCPSEVYRVTKVIGDSLMLDGNHPLAGLDLIFEIEVTSARDACHEDFEEPMIAPGNSYLH